MIAIENASTGARTSRTCRQRLGLGRKIGARGRWRNGPDLMSHRRFTWGSPLGTLSGGRPDGPVKRPSISANTLAPMRGSRCVPTSGRGMICTCSPLSLLPPRFRAPVPASASGMLAVIGALAATVFVHHLATLVEHICP